MAAGARAVPMPVPTWGGGRCRPATPTYRLSIEMPAGFLTLLLGAWGGIIP